MIKGYFKALTGLFCMLAIALSCEKEVEKYDEVVLEPITIGQNMRAATLEIELADMDYISNEWYLYSPTDATWLTHEIIPSTKSMWVMIDGTITGEVRESYIQVRCKGQALKIVVKQDCEPVLEISRSTANFKYQGGTQTVKVVNFADLKEIKAQTEATWCNVEVRNDSIILTASSNEETVRREAVLNISGQRAISGDKVECEVSLSQDKYGQRPSYEYSVDGLTWIEDLPSQFEVLYVKTNNGVKLSGVDMDAFKAAIAAQSSPAGLNLREADYEATTFPMDVFAGTAIKPNKTLKSIAFPRNVKAIAAQAFIYCEALETVDLTGITSLGLEAFRYSGLKNLEIPNTVNAMDKYVFADCLSLENVYYNSTYDAGENGNGGTDKPNEKYIFYTTREDITDGKLVITVGPDTKFVPRTGFRHAYHLVKIICEDAVYFRNYSLAYTPNLAAIEFRCEDESKVSDKTKFHISSPWDDSHVRAGAYVTKKQIIVPNGMLETYKATSIITTFQSIGYEIVEAQ